MKIPLTYNLRSVLPAARVHRAHRARHRARGRGVHRDARARERLRRGADPDRLRPTTCWCCARAPTPSCRAGSTATRSASSPRRPTSRAAPTDARWSSPEVYVVIPLGRDGRHHQARQRRRPRGERGRRGRCGTTSTITEGTRPATGKNGDLRRQASWSGGSPDTGVGETMHFAGRPWTVTCHFSRRRLGVRVGDLGRERADHAGDAARGLPVARPSAWTIRPSFDEAKRVLEADKRVTVDVYRESEFYAKQSRAARPHPPDPRRS